MDKYVKFRQGLITEFEKLTVIEPDTLYFVYDASGTTAELYLGSRKVLGGNANGNPVSLGDIDDVVLKDL